MSMSSYIGDLAAKLDGMSGIRVRAVPVANRFYGESVTVSGLLTGRDIIAALAGTEPDETVILPPNCLNDDGLFLDGLDTDDVSRALGARVVQGGYDPVETFFK
jgi:NifB/MoaA-like Fe-S oxidoreductase